MVEKSYIGDGVYVSHDGYQIWLETQEGSRIALEPSVQLALAEWVRDFYAKYGRTSPLQLPTGAPQP